MKFIEAWPHLREGKKIRNTDYDTEGEYWIAGYMSLPLFYIDEKEVEEKKILTLIRMNKEDKSIRGKNDWGIPCWALMDDKWEIIE